MSALATSMVKQAEHLTYEEKRILLFELSMAFAPVVEPEPDEIEAIKANEGAYERGEYVTMSYEDWFK